MTATDIDPPQRLTLELWADSFHEGDWACRQLAVHAVLQGGSHEEWLDHGFLPTHRYIFDDVVLELRVYGSYRSWDPVPPQINDLLGWGKPDLIAFDAQADRILFAVEETAAVPTGNQALQRCERLYGAARVGIPFWYLLSEFGLHRDGGVRRDSIWPTVMALKLSQDRQVPSVVLHYSDIDNPESYSVGEGLAALFSALLVVLRAYAIHGDPLHGLQPILVDQYASMLSFVESQWSRMLHFMPGEEALSDPQLAANYAAAATRDSQAESIIWSSRFLRWPTVDDLPDAARGLQRARPLIKHDPFSARLEADVGAGRAYGLTENSGSRPQAPAALEAWIRRQLELFATGDDLDPPAAWDMRLDDFPPTASGNRHVTTATRIVFLYDDWRDIRLAVASVFPRLRDALDETLDGRPALVYVSNSIRPGRIFGDPFTGQIAAFSVAFGGLDSEPRVVLAYFPHQAYVQAIGRSSRSNKGLLVMRELTNYLLFGGGVAVSMPDQQPL